MAAVMATTVQMVSSVAYIKIRMKQLEVHLLNILKIPVLGVYFVLNLDEVVKLPAVYRHYRKYGWLKNITQYKMEVGND